MLTMQAILVLLTVMATMLHVAYFSISKVSRRVDAGTLLSPDSVFFEDGIVTLAELKQLLSLSGVKDSEVDNIATVMMYQNDWNEDGVLDKYELGFDEM